MGVSVTVEYSVILPGRGSPLVAPRSVSGSAEFVSGQDIENARLNGIRQAMCNAAKEIVVNLTEAW